MEVALRRRLEGVADVSISQGQQTTAVTFAPGTLVFSAAAFRAALGEADVEVLRLEIEACGPIEAKAGQRWITTAGTHILLRGNAPASNVTCVTGQLNDQVEPNELDVMTIGPAGFGER